MKQKSQIQKIIYLYVYSLQMFSSHEFFTNVEH